MRPSMIRCAFVMAAAILVVADCGGEGVTQAHTRVTVVEAGIDPLALMMRHASASSEPSGAEVAERPAPAVVIAKSAKRGIAYDLTDPADFQVLSPGVSWWYNWSPAPSLTTPTDHRTQYQMDFYPMIRGIDYDVAAVEDYLLAHREIRYLLVMNEPNLVTQADLTPQQAASLWPDFEAIAAKTHVKIVGPAVTWGTMPGYHDPVAWLDAFYAAYEAANDNRPPQIDYLAFHWYDYGLSQQLDRLAKYGKPFWVTEFANWHGEGDGAALGSPARQEAQMADMVRTCESRADVFRYAWFTGRRSEDTHATGLLSASGELTPLGRRYLSLPYAPQASGPGAGRFAGAPEGPRPHASAAPEATTRP